jgi:hypothetical protein
MIHSYKKQSLIVLISLIYIWSCDSITQHGNPIIEDEILANAEVVDQRLTFDTKVQLNIDVKKLKNLSREDFEDVLSKKYQSGFVPAVPIVSDSDIQTIEMLETKMRGMNSWKMKSSTDTQDSEIEFEDIVSDESFASL